MALHLIYGRSGSGKTDFCLRELTQQLGSGSDEALLWLLPEHETFRMEKALAAALLEQGFCRAYVLGFKRLAYRVLNECGGALREHITELGRKLLLGRVLSEHKREWTAFARASRQRSFPEVLLRLLQELKVYGVDAELLRAKAAELESDEELRQKLLDMALAFGAMEEKMGAAYQDNEDCMAELIKRLPQSKLAQGSRVYIDGFRFFNPQELAVIGVLLQNAAEVTVTLCIDDASDRRHAAETDIFYRQYKTREQLLRLAADCYTEVCEQELAAPRRFSQPALQHIEAALYRFDAPAYRAADGVHLLEAANRRREVEAVAADILRLRRQRGWRWRDTALLVRDEAAYAELIETVFRDYEIPFFNERHQQTLHHPLAELLRSSLEAVSRWSYEPLFRVFKTGFFPVTAAELDLLENYVLACGICGSRWLDEADWTYQPGRTVGFGLDAAAELSAVDAIRRRIIAPLVSLSAKLSQAACLRDMLLALYELMEELDIAAQLEQTALAAEQAGRLAEAVSVRQVWDGVMTLLEQMAELSGDEVLSREALGELLNAGLDELTVRLIPPGLDYVTIADFDQNSTANTKAVYIIGANEGIMPRKAGTEGLLSDSDRLKLSELGVELPAGVSADNFGERFLIYSAFSRAAEYLTVSYALADQDGSALLPSPLIKRLRELLPLVTVTLPLDALSAGAAVLGRPKRSLAYLTEVFCQAGGIVQAVPPIWQAVYNWGLAHDFQPELSRQLAGLLRSDRRFSLTPAAAHQLYLGGGRLRGSVTRFEEFRSCPFRHFADYGLKLQERAVYAWQVNELGSFLHEVLRLFGEHLQQAGRQWGDVETEECRSLCHELVQQIAPELKNRILYSSAYYQHLLERIERAALKSLRRLIKLGKNGSFQPIGYEKTFGRGGELAPLVYKLKDGSLLELRGQIDRIDSWQTADGSYIIVIDYKTGNVSLNLLEVYYGLKLQLLTYLLVAYNELRAKASEPVIPAGMLYCFLKTKRLSMAGRCSAEEIEREIDKALKMPGWILADKELVKSFDGLGRFLPVVLDRKGEFSRASQRCIKTPAEFAALLGYVDKIMQETGELILSGDIAARPYQQDGHSVCDYCSFGAVCLHESGTADGALPQLSEDEVMQRICSAVNKEGDKL